jgi:Glyoxalase/Bleomycin resistance protein/Dioxygenase superfamily
MRSEDQFHAGVIVDDFKSARAELTTLFGYEWCEPIAVSTPVALPEGDTVVDLFFAYSVSTPRVELIQSVPGTLWTPVPGSGIHHLGYWSDDVAADSARLADEGYLAEATGTRPDGAPYWAYHCRPDRVRIEIVDRQIQPALEQYWSTGRP